MSSRALSFLPLLVVLAACDDKGGDSSAETGDSPDLVLDPGFGTATVSGTASGSAAGRSCEGAYPDAPQHRVTLTAAMLAMSVAADTTDVVLEIHFGNSTFCSDNDSGLPAVERGSWSAGDYDVYVGTPEAGGSVDYVLTVSEG